jgi:TM2 domain-containing membrane protein YozV
MPKEKASEKNYVTAVVLSGVFGVLGVQHFYLGRIAMGLLDLALSLLFVIFLFLGHWLWIVFFLADVIHTYAVTYLLLVGKFRDGEGRLVTYPGQKI